VYFSLPSNARIDKMLKFSVDKGESESKKQASNNLFALILFSVGVLLYCGIIAASTMGTAAVKVAEQVAEQVADKLINVQVPLGFVFVPLIPMLLAGALVLLLGIKC